MKQLVFLTGTSPVSREETVRLHADYVTELSKFGIVVLSPILYLKHAAVEGAWRRFSETIIPKADELHVLLPDDSVLVGPVKRDIELAGNHKIKIRYIAQCKPEPSKSHTSGNSTESTSSEGPSMSTTKVATF